ncbi:MAG: sigma 54-interacting transcriptional regulator [Halanaerobiales bacterium]
MKNKITVLAIDEQVSKFFKSELEKIFSDLFIIEYRNPEMDVIPVVYDTDLILYTDPEILNILIDKIKCDAPTLMMKRTITKESLNKIREIPAGRKALVANINQYMANETMALLYQLGITDVKFFPFYEVKSDYPEDIEYIIVPENEPYDFLPDIDAEIILIGNRVFDISNVLDILSILRIDSVRAEKIIKRYLIKVPTIWYGFDYGWENRRVLLNQWELLLDELLSGVIITDEGNQIELINYKAKKILKLDKESVTGKDIKMLINRLTNLDFILDQKEVKDKLVKVNGKELVFTVKTVEFDDQFYGKIIIVSPYREMVATQQKVHKQLIGKGHYTDYQFADIIGKSNSIKKSKEISRKIARTDSTVLLLGESGTGKELYAGAIHNYSHRSREPFVAINCATLPENLLESELFGYEEGAFTGARKGGKIGLFEQADGGTIFLDEIGDLPLNLQARLLRAIEEKEIMRLGGNSIVTIDTRIIAATNQDLFKLMNQGNFRKDLFYRLNVFQIRVPALTERKDDILRLTKYYLNKWGEHRNLTQDLKVFLNNYNWPGNVRELINTVKYMVTVEENDLSFINLPDYLKSATNTPKKEMLLLKRLYCLNEKNKNTGRRSLKKDFKHNYYDISEMEIRKLLQSLAEKEMVEISKGRAGTSITDYGLNYLKEKNYIS